MSESTEQTESQEQFRDQLKAYTQQHRAGHWHGSFVAFLEQVLSTAPAQFARSSHQYIWDMLRWSGKEADGGKLHCSLFADELFGIDDALACVAG